jgi:hypothetical protein
LCGIVVVKWGDIGQQGAQRLALGGAIFDLCQ